MPRTFDWCPYINGAFRCDLKIGHSGYHKNAVGLIEPLVCLTQLELQAINEKLVMYEEVLHRIAYTTGDSAHFAKIVLSRVGLL